MENASLACGSEMATAMTCSSAKKRIGTREIALHANRNALIRNADRMAVVVSVVFVQRTRFAKTRVSAKNAKHSARTKSVGPMGVVESVASVMTTLSAVSMASAVKLAAQPVPRPVVRIVPAKPVCVRGTAFAAV